MPLLKYMKNDSAEAQQGLLAWTIDMAAPIKSAIEKGYPLHMLADHIKSYKDTEAFMEAFNDDKFGQCRQTFAEGLNIGRKFRSSEKTGGKKAWRAIELFRQSSECLQSSNTAEIEAATR